MVDQLQESVLNPPRFQLELTKSLPEAFRHVHLSQSRFLRDCLDLLDHSPDMAIHHLRKCTKRIRALLRLIPEYTESYSIRELGSHYASLSRHFGRARETRVNLMNHEMLDWPRQYDPARQVLAQQCQQALDQALKDRSTRLEESVMLVKLPDLPAVVDWSLLAGGLERTYGKARKTLRKVQSDPGIQVLHRWRKRVKTLWYQVQLALPVLGSAAESRCGQLDELGALLGDIHDIQVLQTLLKGDSLFSGFPPENTHYLSIHIDTLVMEALATGARFFHEDPKVWIGSIPH